MKRKRRSLVWAIPKRELEQLVQQSKFMKELLLKLGYTSQGGVRRVIIERLKEDNIDYSHFGVNYDQLRKDASKWVKPKLTINEMFQSNTPHSSGTLKRRIIQDKLLQYQCEKCPCNDQWQGQKLCLQLDHKNGNITDNRLENLRFLCPNCHSQTSTFSGKNIRGIRPKKSPEELKIQRKQIGYNQRRVKDRPTKEILLQQIANIGFVKTGEVYGVSDNAIRKWLK